MQVLIQRDTRAWQLQGWVSFLLAVFLYAVGLAWLPGGGLERAFMVMGCVFCLSAAFVLAKFVRDGEQARREQRPAGPPLFALVVWGGFVPAMQREILSLLLASALLVPPLARAQSEASTLSALSAVPVASVVGTASVAAGALVVVPLALSTAGAVLVVQAVDISARGTVVLLERAPDGARVSIEIAGRGLEASALAVGSAVTVVVLGSGVLLSAAGEVLAFIPNALGQALLINERLTR